MEDFNPHDWPYLLAGLVGGGGLIEAAQMGIVKLMMGSNHDTQIPEIIDNVMRVGIGEVALAGTIAGAAAVYDWLADRRQRM